MPPGVRPEILHTEALEPSGFYVDGLFVPVVGDAEFHVLIRYLEKKL